MSVLFAFVLAAASVPAPDDLAIQAMHNFGACVVAQTPHGAEQVLAMDYRTREYQKRLRAIAKGHDRCAPGSTLKFNGVLFAGAMAEALLKSDVSEEALAQRLAYDPARAVIPARSPTETMALCAVLNAPQASGRLFATEPTSPDESKTMQVLGPVLVECLKKDMKLTMNKPALRSLLALAAWRIASTPKVSAQ